MSAGSRLRPGDDRDLAAPVRARLRSVEGTTALGLEAVGGTLGEVEVGEYEADGRAVVGLERLPRLDEMQRAAEGAQVDVDDLSVQALFFSATATLGSEALRSSCRSMDWQTAAASAVQASRAALKA